MDGVEGQWRKQRIVRRSSGKRIERVEDGVDGRQARENEKIEGVESHQANVSEKMEDGGERRQARGDRDKVGWIRGVT